MKNTLLRYTLHTIGILFLCLAACKKDIPTVDTDPDPQTGPPATTDRVSLTNDSIFYYAQALYYWNTTLPTYETYNPRQYTTGDADIDKYQNNLFNIAQYSGNDKYDLINVDGQRYIKYSYIEDVSEAGGVSAGIRNLTADVNLLGKGNDIGIYNVSVTGYLNDFEVAVLAVYPGSPAAKAGLTRGTRITSIDNRSIGSNWNTDSAYVYRIINDPSSIELGGTRLDGTTFANVSLQKGTYDSSPVYKDTVLTFDNRKVGYLAFARFSYDDNANGPLDEAFAKFNGVEDLVVDLRYNGGGFVNTAEYLANLIVPSGVTGTMFIENYTASLQDGSTKEILKNQPVRDETGEIVGRSTYFDYDYTPNGQDNTIKFSKKGSLNTVKNVVFLVTGSTASASELLINALRSSVSGLNVRIVGTTTYGKPVGFFPVRLEGKYDLYLPSFSTINGDNQGDYYEGFKPGQDIPGKEMVDAQGQDLEIFDVLDFGDPNEAYLKEALNQLGVSVSSGIAASPLMYNRSQRRATASGTMNLKRALNRENKGFNGMIETRNRN